MSRRNVAARGIWTNHDLALVEDLACAEARENFWAFRQWLHPALIRSWYQREAAAHMQQFYEDYLAGKRPKLAWSAPPQHGKTMQVTDFIAWLAGKHPELKSIFTSYSDDLGVAVNFALQRIFESERYQRCFGTRISEVSASTASDGRYLRNSSLLEFVGTEGSFRNTTVQGQVTGKGLDFGFIDDPIKGRKEANSPTVRNATWNWFTDDFLTRFSDQAALLIVMTRWHLDDPTGRFVARFPATKVVKFKAIAEHDEEYRKTGEPLFPELKSLEFLMERKALLSRASWEALYQQEPIIAGGELFPVEQFEVVNNFDRKQIISSVRYWDKAGTEGGGAFTCGVLMHALRDKTYLVEDVRRGQWSALEREKHIKQAAQIDAQTLGGAHKFSIYVEQEPGSGGKESAEATVRMLAGYIVKADKVTGSKEYRAEPYAAQVQGGNVKLLAGLWVRAFLDEHEVYPGRYKDQIDAAAGAFNKLAGSGSGYLLSSETIG